MTKYKKTALISSIGLVVLLVLLILALSSNRSKNNTTQRPSNASLPVAGSIEGTPSIENYVVDYFECQRGSWSISLPLGSDHVVMLGKENDNCVFYIGGEIENPTWDGVLATRCEVPTSTPKISYRDPQIFDRYCNNAE